jgi:DNA gyrase subunit A
LSIRPEEKILALLAKGKIDDLSNLKYLVMATKNGIIKKTPFEQFKNLRSSGLIAINLKKGDLLREVKKTKGDWQIVLITKDGFGIRFNEKEVRPMARGASGIKAIRLQKGDEVIGMEVIEKQKKKGRKEYLLVVTENGYGKMTPVSGYRLQKRGGKGLKTAKITKKTGKLVASKILTGEEDLIIVSKKGQIIRVLAKNIPVLSRTTQGVRLMRLGSGDKIASLINI